MDMPKDGFEFLEELKKRNGKDIQDFRDYNRFLDSKARQKGIPIHGQFELTPLCNLSCKMCYVHLDAEQLKGQKVFPVETWKDLMREAWEAGMLSATLTGGECLSYPGFDELFLYLYGLGCRINILTNGLLMDDHRIQFFKEHTPEIIQVTLYGCNDDVYERVTGRRVFSIVVENVRKAIEAGLPVILSVTPNVFIGEDILETVRIGKSISKEFAVNSAIFSPREETGRTAQDPDLDLYIRIYRLINELDGRENGKIAEDKLPPVGGPCHECSECGLPCGAGRSSFALNWQGVMMACNRMNMIRADALKNGFMAAWIKVNQEASNWPRVPECIECSYYDVCNNCTANMLRFAEPGKRPTALCERTKKLVQHCVRHIPACE